MHKLFHHLFCKSFPVQTKIRLEGVLKTVVPVLKWSIVFLCHLLELKSPGKHKSNINRRNSPDLSYRYKFDPGRLLPVCLLIFILFLPEKSFQAQPVIHPFKHFTTHDGLAGIVNTAIYQDSRGYIWIGGMEGVSVYNGYEFNTIEDHYSFSTEHIYGITEDKQGRILILSETHLTRYNGERFEVFPLPFNAIGGGFKDLFSNKILLFIWGHYRGGLFELINNSFQQIFHSGTDTIEKIELSKNELYIGSSAIQDTTAMKFYISDGQNLRSIILNDVFINHYFVGTYSYFLDPQVTIFDYGKEPDQKYIVANIRSGDLKIYSSREEIYHEYKSRYLIHKNPPGKEGFFIYNNIRDEYYPIPDFKTDVVRHTFEDRDGRLWVLSNTGVYKFFLNGIMRLGEEPALYSWGVSEWQNRLFFHTYLDGLATFKDDQWSFIPNKFSNGEIFPGRAASSEDFHFVPAWDGIFGVDSRFQPFFLNTERFAEGLWVDTDKNELLAGDFRNLYFFDLRDLSLRKKIELPAQALRIGIYNIEKRDELIWLAGPGGIISYNQQSDEFNTFTFEEGKLPCKSSTNLFIDEWNGLWATGNCGLLRWNEGTQAFEKLPLSGSLGALVDVINIGNGRYLISSNKGLFLVELERNRQGENQSYSFRVIKEFNHRNGFDGIKPFLSGFYRDSLNRIWVPTTTGTYVINIEDLKLETSSSLIRLLSIGNQSFGFDHPANSIVQLEYGSRNVDIAFDMVSFDWPGQPKFQFRLTGQEKWSTPQSDRIVRLMDLDHGNHELQIRPIFSDRPEEQWPVLKASFNTHLPVWERTWFPLMIAAIILFILIGLITAWLYNWRMRLKHFQTYNHLQLLQIHALESQLNPHFIFNVLSNIQKKVVLGEPEEANEMIVKLGTLMRRYLNSIETGVEHSGVLHKINLANELELIRLYMDFEKEKYNHKFDYQIEIDTAIVPEETVIFPMLIQPFIENCIKHGFNGIDYKGEIAVKVSKVNEQLIFKISDNGIGRTASQKIYRQQKYRERSKGNLLVSRRVGLLQKLGYNIQLTYKDLQQGTQVEIRTPIF